MFLYRVEVKVATNPKMGLGVFAKEFISKKSISVYELCDVYLTNVYLYLSHKMASKSRSRSAAWKIIDTQFLNDVESTIFVPDSDKFRQTIADHAELIENKHPNCTFGIDSNPILGKAIRLYFDKLRKKKFTYRSIYDEWEPTWRYHPN